MPFAVASLLWKVGCFGCNVRISFHVITLIIFIVLLNLFKNLFQGLVDENGFSYSFLNLNEVNQAFSLGGGVMVLSFDIHSSCLLDYPPYTEYKIFWLFDQ